MLKLAEVFLPLTKESPNCCVVDLPIGTAILKFGAQVEQGQIQAPGPDGRALVQLKPLMLCLLDPEGPVARRRFFLATVNEPIPDGATYIDGFGLPNGVFMHLLEIPLTVELPRRQMPLITSREEL
jgi:hypothetical protein